MLINENEIQKWIHDHPEEAKLYKKTFLLCSETEREEYEMNNPIDEWEILRVILYKYISMEAETKLSGISLLLKSRKFNVYRIGYICDGWSYSEIPASYGEILLKNTAVPYSEYTTDYAHSATERYSISNT